MIGEASCLRKDIDSTDVEAYGKEARLPAQIFDSVWYLPNENTWRDFKVLAYRDKGKLTVSEGSIEFHGTMETVVITNIKRVNFGKQGRDFVNNWVKIEYGDSTSPSVAFFADGSLRGWGGIFGGTKRILGAVEQHFSPERLRKERR